MDVMDASSDKTFTVNLDYTEDDEAAHVDAVTYPDVETAAEAVARLVGRDVRHIVRAGHIDLGRDLGMTPGTMPDPAIVVELLLADLERMLRKHLISQVHLFLSERGDGNPAQPAQPAQMAARYHAHYEVRENVALIGNAAWSDIVHAPPRLLINAHFALAVSWRRGLAYERAQAVRPPEYTFVWTPDRRDFEASDLMRYRFGTAAASTGVAPTEYAALRYRASY